MAAVTLPVAELARAQVVMLKASAEALALAHSRYTDSLRAIEKRVGQLNEEVTRMINTSAAEAVRVSAEVVKFEAEIRHYETLLESLGK